jgi:hypothetical protein
MKRKVQRSRMRRGKTEAGCRTGTALSSEGGAWSGVATMSRSTTGEVNDSKAENDDQLGFVV